MGDYGVQSIFADSDLRSLGAAFVFCANDPVGVAGGVENLKQVYGIEADVISGPATDNRVGVRFVEKHVGRTAINARSHAKQLGEHLLKLLGERGLRKL
jgi:hypothetical protein